MDLASEGITRQAGLLNGEGRSFKLIQSWSELCPFLGSAYQETEKTSLLAEAGGVDTCLSHKVYPVLDPHFTPDCSWCVADPNTAKRYRSGRKDLSLNGALHYMVTRITTFW